MRSNFNYLYYPIINSFTILTVIERGLSKDGLPLVTNADYNVSAVEICKPKDFLTNCLSQLPSILKDTEQGLPASAEDVDAICKGFKTGMNCIHEYSVSCLTNERRQKFENSVQGARHTFKFLCDDPGFKAEYLKYTTCLRGIRMEWDDCANRFIGLVKEEFSRENNSTSRLVELCCARYGFINCVGVATRLKCRKEEIMFITKIADTLSNMRVYAPYCKHVNFTLCSSAQSMSSQTFLFFTLLTLFESFFRNNCSKMKV